MDYHGLLTIGIIVLLLVWVSLGALGFVYFKKKDLRPTSASHKIKIILGAMVFAGIFPIGITLALVIILVRYL
jgi:uncharacterized protein (DUF2062 family)